MKKRLVTFLRYIELETSLRFDLSVVVVPLKFIDPVDGHHMIRNMVFSNNGTLALFITNYDSKRNRKVKSLEVFCGNEANLNNAIMMKIKIESVLPYIPITICNGIEGLMKHRIY